MPYTFTEDEIRFAFLKWEEVLAVSGLGPLADTPELRAEEAAKNAIASAKENGPKDAQFQRLTVAGAEVVRASGARVAAQTPAGSGSSRSRRPNPSQTAAATPSRTPSPSKTETPAAHPPPATTTAPTMPSAMKGKIIILSSGTWRTD
jgi:hypothetical protein